MLRLASLILLLALLTACVGPAVPGGTPTPDLGVPSPGPQPTETGADQATISFAIWDYERASYEPLVEKFKAEHPGINVVLVPLDDLMMSSPNSGVPESPTATLRRIVAGADTAPAFAVTPEAFGTALLLDLKPLMDADATFQRDDFYPGALERWTINGGTWALPRSFFVQTLNYNKDLFQLTGLPDPQPDWAWSDLLAAAEQIHAAGGSSTYGYLDSSGGMLPMLAILGQGGVDLLNTPAEDIQLTDQVYEEALEQIRQLYRDGVLVNPYGDGKGGQQFDPQVLLREGRVGIWGDFGMFGPDGQPEQPGYAVGKASYPSDLVTDQIFGGGAEGYIVSGGTAHPEAAWQWIEFLSRQPVEQPGNMGWQPPGRVPARQSLADALGFWNDMDEQAAAIYRAAIEQGVPTSTRQPDYSAIGALSQALSQVTSDPKANIKTALSDAQRQLEDMRAQVGLTPTPEPDTSPVIVATPEPQEVPAGATVVTFASWGYGGPELRRVIRAFREEHPEIYVQIKSTDNFSGSVAMNDLAGVSDCFTWPQGIQTDKEAASLLDLRPLIDSDQTFARDDIPAGLLSMYERDGQLLGLPYAFNVRTLVYNRALLDAAGVTPPSGGAAWTADEFLQAAQALSSGEGDARIYGYVPLGGPQADILFFTDMLGGRLVSGIGQEARPTFTDPETVTAINWFLELPGVHKVTPPYAFSYKRDSGGNDRSYELIQGSKAAMWFDYGRGGFGQPMPLMEGAISKPIAPDGPTLDVGIAPLPVGDSGLGRGDLYARGFHISKSAQNPQACWEFIKYLSADVSQIYGDIPARSSVAQSEAYKAVAGPDRLEVLELYREVLSRPMRQGTDPNSFYMMDSYWFFKAVDEAAQGKATLEAGLEEAQRATTTFAECVAKGGKPPACALEADPEYQGYNVEMPEGITPKG